MRNVMVLLIAAVLVSALPQAAGAQSDAGPTLERARVLLPKSVEFLGYRVRDHLLSPDLTHLAFQSNDLINIYDIGTDTPLQSFSARPADVRFERWEVRAGAFSLDNKWFYTIVDRKKIDLTRWRITPGVGLDRRSKAVFEPEGEPLILNAGLQVSSPYRVTGFSPNSTHCALAGRVFTTDPPALAMDTGGQAVSFSADGLHLLAFGGSLGKTAVLYALVDDGFVETARFQHKAVWDHEYNFNGIAYDPAHGWIAQSVQGKVTIWDLESGDVLGEIPFQVPDIIEFNADGSLLRVASSPHGGYSMGTIYSTATFRPVGSDGFRARFSHDGHELVSYTDNTGFVFDRISQPPPFLEIAAAFDDTASGGNGKLDSGETAALVLKVTNTGRGSAFGVTTHTSLAAEHVAAARTVTLGAVPAGVTRELRIPIKADPAAQSGSVRIQIETRESGGFDAQPIAFDLEVHRVEPPLLALGEDVLIDDTPSANAEAVADAVAQQVAALARLDGNGDGVLQNGETARVSIPIANRGAGMAYGVVVDAKPPASKVRLESARAEVGDIAPGATAYAEFVVQVDESYPGADLVLPVLVREVRPSVKLLKADAAVPYTKLEPVLEFTYRLHDGGTPASRGNANGRIEQGELVELALTVTNAGTAPAAQVVAKVMVRQDGVAIDRGEASLGDLAPSGAAGEATLTFMVQRAAIPGPLPLTLLFSMDDFPSQSQQLNFDIAESGVAMVSLERIQPETGDEIWLPVRLDEVGKIWNLVVDPLDPRKIYLATDTGGVLLSDDRGLSWRSLNDGLEDLSVRCLALAPAPPGLLLAGTAGMGVYRLEGVATAWIPSSNGIDEQDGRRPVCRTLDLPRGESDAAYLGTDRGLYVSKDRGRKWSLQKKLPGTDVLDITLMAGLEDALLALLGDGGLFRSTDRGKSWESLLGDDLLGGIIRSALSVATDPQNAERIFLSSGLEGILRSLDGGRNWQRIPADRMGGGPGPQISIGSILINPTNPTIIYAGAEDGRVFESRDDGDSWRSVGFAADSGRNGVSGMLRAGPDGSLFAGGESGLYQLGDVRSRESVGNVIFRSSSSELPTEISTWLESFVEILASDRTLQATVEGHTDNIGTQAANRKLAQQRADEVKSFLVEHGIDAGRIVSRGFGWERPVDTNETPEGRSRNRRVEVMLAGPRGQ